MTSAINPLGQGTVPGRATRFALAVLLVVAVSVLLVALRDSLTAANFSLIYTLVVLATAIRLGTGPSLVTAVTCLLCFNFFLVRPYYTFFVSDSRDLLDLLVFLLVAIITGQLASFARKQARTATERAAEQEVLIKLTSAFNQLADRDAVFSTLRAVLREDLAALDSRVLPRDAPRSASPSTVYAVLQGADTHYGTLAVTFAAEPSHGQARLVAACAAQAATALQRIDLARRAQQSRTFEEADRLKTALLQAVSHDLRTPLTIIKSSIGNLASRPVRLSDDDEREILRIADQEADELNEMVEDLLDMSRLQAGALHLNLDWYSLEEVAGEIAAQVWKRTGRERVALHFPDDMPLTRLDYGLMLRAVSNLVDNALRFEPDERTIELRGDSDDTSVALRVVNHGPSIRDEERAHLTEPFYHGTNGGTGLGLAIARGIIETHRGRLLIEDTPGGGATFVVTLPRAEAAPYEHPDR